MAYWAERQMVNSRIARIAGAKLRDTHWGVVVGADEAGRSSALISEASLKFFGLVTILSAGVQWLYPSLMPPVEALAVKIALMSGFLAVGFAVFHYAHGGFLREFEVDRSKHEVRVVTKNFKGERLLRQRVSFRDIESCFLRRFDGRKSQSRLYFRLRDTPSFLLVACGTERELESVLERLIAEMKPEKAGKPNAVARLAA
jgi:hypothetical protein